MAIGFSDHDTSPEGARAPNDDQHRVFLLSPASSSGERARLLRHREARFDLARRLRGRGGVEIGEVFSFLSGLYFRGKLGYARAFARPPAGVPGVLVITAADGLRPAEASVTLSALRRYARIPIDVAEARYVGPLLRDARALAAAVERFPCCEVVLLGSIATGKYIEPLDGVFGSRLRFPAEFVGRGDMSRGGLMLRCARDGRELTYVPVAGAARHGGRPARLVPEPRNRRRS